jgi:CDP-paratose 2-epimerase
MFSHTSIVITGGAGFVGSSIAVSLLQRYCGLSITCVDNLKRRGSELNLPRLKHYGARFVHADIRVPEDFDQLGPCELVIDCSAEPSVLAGYSSSPLYIINTNLSGTTHCLDYARRHSADFTFLSTSRVYPIDPLNQLTFLESASRFEPAPIQQCSGISTEGVAEDFPLLPGNRSLYGATKLASELLIAEYVAAFGMRAVVNRCGILTGPWQMGKVDQGVVVLWLARHLFGQPLSYIGFGGQGKQVRDILHVEDLVDLLCVQLGSIDKHSAAVYNVGGGRHNALSLCELSSYARELAGATVPIGSDGQTRAGDLKYYVSDNRRVQQATGWSPTRSIETILEQTWQWLVQNRTTLEQILA